MRPAHPSHQEGLRTGVRGESDGVLEGRGEKKKGAGRVWKKKGEKAVKKPTLNNKEFTRRMSLAYSKTKQINWKKEKNQRVAKIKTSSGLAEKFYLR